MTNTDATTSLPKEIDVVVVGMGGAGLAAAITAHDAGADVLILEKTHRAHAGGNSRVSGQVAFSPRDAAEAKVHLRAMGCDYPPEESVVTAWADESSQNHDWIQARIEEVRGVVPRDAGDPLSPDEGDVIAIEYGTFRAYAGEKNPPRDEYWEIAGNDCGTETHIIGGSMGFSRLWLTLLANVERRGIPIHYSTPAVALEQGADGDVEAVVVEHDGTRSPIGVRQGVVLATGGFAGSPEMTRNYLRLPDAIAWGSPHNTGDGIRMAQKLGADLAHPYNYMSMPGLRTEGRHGEAAQVRNNNYIEVGADGRRFINETVGSRHGKAGVRGGFDFYPGHDMWTIFDEKGRLGGPLVFPRANFPVGWMKQTLGYEWSPDSSAEIEKGWIAKADTVRELAEKLGIDADGLEDEVARYNEHARAGEDPRFGRPAEKLEPLETGPFYGYRWGQLLITTLGGIRKDGDARVIDVDGNTIPRLYAAGDTASSYTWLLSGGMGLGDALAFGRIAGRNAASEIRRGGPHALAAAG